MNLAELNEQIIEHGALFVAEQIHLNDIEDNFMKQLFTTLTKISALIETIAEDMHKTNYLDPEFPVSDDIPDLF